MVERRPDLYLTPEALIGRGIAGHIFVRDLEHYLALVLLVARVVDLAHTAASEFFQYGIVIDAFSGMQAHIIGIQLSAISFQHSTTRFLVAKEAKRALEQAIRASSRLGNLRA